jgi:hypothetical protein
MSSVGFEPKISSDEQPQTHALDHAAALGPVYVHFISQKYVIGYNMEKQLFLGNNYFWISELKSELCN